MPHAPPLIATVTLGFVFAFAFGVLARRLGLPPLVGYLLAGVAVGPYTPGFVGDINLVAQLAEVGVILLMFGVGLHVSLKDLIAVYPIAVPGALAQMGVALGAGAALGMWWGWGPGSGLLLGLALSVASTVVLLRVFEERGILDGVEGRIAVGWLIVQDLAMVLALVLLPPLAAQDSAQSLGAAVALTLAKVALFLVLVLAIGLRAVPWLLAMAARTRSRELFTLSVLACALGIAFGSAELFGVSFALGAFFAGVVLSESDVSQQAAANSLPLQDAFAVLFFVSVGMLFDPSIVVREPGRVAAVLVVVVLIKSIAALAVVLVTRRPLISALTIAVGLAQVGEFSFLLAGLGVGLDMLPPDGRDLILAGAILSITLNPALVAATQRLSVRLEARSQRGPAWLRGRHPTAPPDSPPAVAPKRSGHAVVVGHGRVGALVCRMLADCGRRFVVVELDRQRSEDLRERGREVVWGDAGAPGVLAAAGVARARVLVITAPGAARDRRIVTTAKEVNPGLDIVVRAQGERDIAWLEQCGVGMAATGERELALAMAGYAVAHMGVPEAEARDVVQRFRAELRVGVGLDGLGAPSRVPELRPRREDEAETTP
jgi:monovalent cation:H+ antiporter-2, CPA2 family